MSQRRHLSQQQRLSDRNTHRSFKQRSQETDCRTTVAPPPVASKLFACFRLEQGSISCPAASSVCVDSEIATGVLVSDVDAAGVPVVAVSTRCVSLVVVCARSRGIGVAAISHKSVSAAFNFFCPESSVASNFKSCGARRSARRQQRRGRRGWQRRRFGN